MATKNLNARLEALERQAAPEPSKIPYVVWDEASQQQQQEAAAARAAGRPIIHLKISGVNYADI